MLNIPRLHLTNQIPSPEEVSEILKSEVAFQNLETVNWPNFPYKPDVKFRMGHTGQEILLQYQVNEKYIRAQYTEDNDSVWNDSCVEFFISPVNDGSYYNIEFNCIGTALIGFGDGKEKRQRAGKEITSQIRRVSSLGKNAITHSEGLFTWELTLAIPISAFFKHQLTSLSGLQARANFYKCGDELKEPHYLSWNPIHFHKPNFHLPDFFGDILFE